MNQESFKKNSRIIGIIGAVLFFCLALYDLIQAFRMLGYIRWLGARVILIIIQDLLLVAAYVLPGITLIRTEKDNFSLISSAGLLLIPLISFISGSTGAARVIGNLSNLFGILFLLALTAATVTNAFSQTAEQIKSFWFIPSCLAIFSALAFLLSSGIGGGSKLFIFAYTVAFVLYNIWTAFYVSVPKASMQYQQDWQQNRAAQQEAPQPAAQEAPTQSE